jgi:ceramide glucosyltransferase
VAGAEPGCLENFRTFCQQDYPSYEIVFATSRSDDPVIGVVEQLKAEFPEKEIRWVLAEENPGPNYKVGNLVAAVRNARYDFLVMSDSDMRVEPDYLRRVAAEFERGGAGALTCLYRGVAVRGIAAALQALFIQTDFVPNVLLGKRLEGISYGFGATIAATRQGIEEIGGLEPLREYLADDYQIVNRICGKGGRATLSTLLVDHASTLDSFRAYFSHHLRWSITQRVSRPAGYTASVVTHGVSLALLFLLLRGFSHGALAVFLLVLAVRFLTFLHVDRAVFRNRRIIRYAWLLPVKDLLNTLVWFLSLFTNTVSWRGRRFRILKSGKMVEIG